MNDSFSLAGSPGQGEPQFQTNGASWPSCDAHQIACSGSKFAQNISFQIVRSQYVYKTYVNVHRSALNTFFCLFEEIDYTVQLATACMLLHVHNCMHSHK